MSELTEKIKNIFKRKEKSETSEPPQDKSFSDAMWGANDVARSIRASERLKMQKKLWRNIFHF